MHYEPPCGRHYALCDYAGSGPLVYYACATPESTPSVRNKSKKGSRAGRRAGSRASRRGGAREPTRNGVNPSVQARVQVRVQARVHSTPPTHLDTPLLRSCRQLALLPPASPVPAPTAAATLPLSLPPPLRASADGSSGSGHYCHQRTRLPGTRTYWWSDCALRRKQWGHSGTAHPMHGGTWWGPKSVHQLAWLFQHSYRLFQTEKTTDLSSSREVDSRNLIRIIFG